VSFIKDLNRSIYLLLRASEQVWITPLSSQAIFLFFARLSLRLLATLALAQRVADRTQVNGFISSLAELV